MENMKEFYLEKIEEERKVYELVKIGFEAKILELSGQFSSDDEKNERIIAEIEDLVMVVKNLQKSIKYCEEWLKEFEEKENAKNV